jgi:hypothetical protein
MSSLDNHVPLHNIGFSHFPDLVLGRVECFLKDSSRHNPVPSASQARQSWPVLAPVVIEAVCLFGILGQLVSPSVGTGMDSVSIFN